VIAPLAGAVVHRRPTAAEHRAVRRRPGCGRDSRRCGTALRPGCPGRPVSTTSWRWRSR